MEELLFKKGQLANLPKERQTGTFYVTEDAKTIYIDNMVIQDTEDVKEELIGIIVDNELVTAESLTYLNENKADITALDAVEDKIPVKTSQLTNDSGYITLNDVPEVDLSGYSKTGHTHNDLYYTETEINTKLNGKQDTISDLETIRSGATLGATALQSVPDTYVTESELTNKGYLTAIPSEYITETELNDKGYLTSVPSEYVTETELNGKGYLTAIPSEYITEDELSAKNYLYKVEITQEDYNALETKDKNALYVITDSNQDDESRFVTIAEMNTKISEMQALITSLQGEITTLKNELNKTLVVE